MTYSMEFKGFPDLSRLRVCFYSPAQPRLCGLGYSHTGLCALPYNSCLLLPLITDASVHGFPHTTCVYWTPTLLSGCKTNITSSLKPPLPHPHRQLSFLCVPTHFLHTFLMPVVNTSTSPSSEVQLTTSSQAPYNTGFKISPILGCKTQVKGKLSN
jgi:hypothetical protein